MWNKERQTQHWACGLNKGVGRVSKLLKSYSRASAAAPMLTFRVSGSPDVWSRGGPRCESSQGKLDSLRQQSRKPIWSDLDETSCVRLRQREDWELVNFLQGRPRILRHHPSLPTPPAGSVATLIGRDSTLIGILFAPRWFFMAQGRL